MKFDLKTRFLDYEPQAYNTCAEGGVWGAGVVCVCVFLSFSSTSFSKVMKVQGQLTIMLVC